MDRWEEKEIEHNKIIEEAVSAADTIILNGSNGEEEETNYLTAMVADRLLKKALLPFKAAMQRKNFEGV